jgi:hypothetical protein
VPLGAARATDALQQGRHDGDDANSSRVQGYLFLVDLSHCRAS